MNLCSTYLPTSSIIYSGRPTTVNVTKKATLIKFNFSGWIHNLAERLKVSIENVSHADSYVTALYFTCSSLTSVGFGNVSANTTNEKIFSICTMLIGGKNFVLLLQRITSLILELKVLH